MLAKALRGKHEALLIMEQSPANVGNSGNRVDARQPI